MGDLGQLNVAKGFEKLPKVQKSPNLATLVMDNDMMRVGASLPFYLFDLYIAQLWHAKEGLRVHL